MCFRWLKTISSANPDANVYVECRYCTVDTHQEARYFSSRLSKETSAYSQNWDNSGRPELEKPLPIPLIPIPKYRIVAVLNDDPEPERGGKNPSFQEQLNLWKNILLTKKYDKFLLKNGTE
jgi:hypothetical protein